MKINAKQGTRLHVMLNPLHLPAKDAELNPA